MATADPTSNSETDRIDEALAQWDWVYESHVPCRLIQTADSFVGSIRVQPGHKWHRLPPEACRVRGEPVDVRGGIANCKPYGSSWLIEIEGPVDGDDALADAVFELELLADSAAYLEALQTDRRAA